MHSSSDGATTSPPPLRLVRSRWQLTAGLGASLLLAAASALLLVRHADRLAATAYPLLVLVLGVLWAVLLRAFVRSHRRQARLLHDLQSQAALLKETRRIAGIGDWTWELDTGRVHWSDEVYRIHGQAPRTDGLHIDALGAWIHPEDRDRVESYFTRMLANGDAMETEYRIVRRDGEMLRIEVRDTGPGIAEGDQAAIFEEFRRGDDVGGGENRRQLGPGDQLRVAQRGGILVTRIAGQGQRFAARKARRNHPLIAIRSFVHPACRSTSWVPGSRRAFKGG